MRIRLSNRLALLVAVGVMATTIGAARLSPSPTYASQATTVGSWQQVALQGFGNPGNGKAWSMAWFNNKLFVGTQAEEYCYLKAVAHQKNPAVAYPPYMDPADAYTCNPNPWALPLSGQIWSMDPTKGMPFTQTNWSMVYQSPYTVPVVENTGAMTLAARDIAFRDMAVYIESGGTPALYVGGVDSSGLNGPGVPPASLLRSTDGLSFQAVPADPGTVLGNIHAFGYQADSFRGGVTYNGHLFVTITNYGGSGEVFASANPSQGDNSFQQITPNTMVAYEIAAFNGHLYIGTASGLNGYSVWRTDCTAPPPGQRWCPASDFTQIVPPGAGLGASASNCSVTSMQVYTDTAQVPHLYVGSAACKGGPAEIVRINQNDTDPASGWDLVVGNPRFVGGPGQCNCTKSPLSNLGEGFGWYFNQHMWRMADDAGVLFVGTYDSSTYLKNSLTPQQLQAFLPYMGFDLWASLDGVTFFPVTLNGFGDVLSAGARTLQPSPYGLFVGSVNGFQGLRIWLGSLLPGALQLAPRNLQIDGAAGGGTDLTWDAPRHATLFHVYRATAVRMALPRLGRAARKLVGLLGPLPHGIWVPGAYREIGTTSASYFVDRHARAGRHYSYYVVAQDARGNRSAPSNVTLSPAMVPVPTFQSIRVGLASLAASRELTPGQAAAVSRAMQAAYGRLRAGDAWGSRAVLATLRRRVPSLMHGPQGRLYAEELDGLLGRLEKRVMLVGAHVLASSWLQGAHTPLKSIVSASKQPGRVW